MVAKTIPIMTGIAHSAAEEPLLAALLARLPGLGQPFPADKRANWLRMWQMALDDLYGVAEDMPAFLRAVTSAGGGMSDKDTAVTSPRLAHAGHDFYINIDGRAHHVGSGAPALMSEVPEGEVIFDHRPPIDGFRDKDGIVWADGTRGTMGIASGVSFCGPG